MSGDVSRGIPSPTSIFQIHFFDEYDELSESVLLTDDKPPLPDHQLYHPKINVISTLYDWGHDTYSSKAFLSYLIQNMLPEKLDSDVGEILRLCTTIGLCSSSMFTRNYEISSRVIEMAFDDALIRRPSMAPACLTANIRQFECCLHVGYPILCTMHRDVLLRFSHGERRENEDILDVFILPNLSPFQSKITWMRHGSGK